MTKKSKVKYFNLPSHLAGGGKIDANGNLSSTNPVAEIEKKEVVQKLPNKDLYVYSDKLGIAAKLKADLAKIKGDTPLEKKTRQLILDKMQRFNDMAKSQASDVSPQYALGGIVKPLLSLIPGVGPVASIGATVLDAFSKPAPSIPNPLPKSISRTTTDKPAYLQNIDDVSGIPEQIATQNKPSFSQMLTKNLPTGLHALGIAGSVINNFRKPEVDTPIQAQFGKGDNLVSGTGIDPQALINKNEQSFAAAADQIGNTASGANQYLNRLRGLSSAKASQNSASLLQAKQFNDQTALQRAGREDRNAMFTQQEIVRTDIANAQNRAMSQDAMQSMFNQFTNIANGLDKKQFLEAQTAQMNENQQRQFLLNMATLAVANPNVAPGNIQYIIDNIDTLSVEEIKSNLIKFNI